MPLDPAEIGAVVRALPTTVRRPDIARAVNVDPAGEKLTTAIAAAVDAGYIVRPPNGSNRQGFTPGERAPIAAVA